MRVRVIVVLATLVGCGRLRFDAEDADGGGPPEPPPMAKLVPADAVAGAQVGHAVAVDGALIVIGADGAEGSRGRAYAYRLDTDGWQLDGTLVASDGVAMDYLGGFVAVADDRLAAGADGADPFGPSSGAAYVFDHGGSTWAERAKLVTPDTTDFAYLGQTLAIDRDHLIVGCRYCDQLGTDAGAAYVWSTSDLTAPPAVLVAGGAGGQFGVYVSISGPTAAVSRTADSTRGAVHVYRQTGSGFAPEAVLLASDGVAPDEFGIGLAVDGDVLLAGAFDKDAGTGAAYVFRFDGTTWNEEQKLVASDAMTNAWFGRNVAVSGDLAVIGSPNRDGNAGAAYVFRYDGVRWNETAKLEADVPTPGDRYGYAVALSGTIAVIGCPFDDDQGPDSGSVYAYNLAP
jgi:hypothetical protein